MKKCRTPIRFVRQNWKRRNGEGNTEKALSVTKTLSVEITEQTGVESSFEEGNINDYLVQVMRD
jgi:coproporphyrinogen III oxidase